jgi:hypothetical protein
METGGAIDSTKDGFLKHVFAFDTDTKNSLMNSFQYFIISFVPILAVQYLIGKLWEEDHEKKEILQLLGEIIGEISMIILAIYFINRAVMYIPSYSGTPIEAINMIQLVLTAVLFKLNFRFDLGIKTKLLVSKAEKIILGEKSGTPQKSNTKNVVKVSQPISGGGRILPPAVPTHQASRSDYIGTHTNQMPPVQQQAAPSSSMYGGQPTPLQNAATPQLQSGGNIEGMTNANTESMEPMAANGVLGGGSSWSAF